MPPPVPPSVKAGRMIAGRPISCTKLFASSRLVTVRDFGWRRPRPSTMFRNTSRSSPRRIASRLAPIIFTPSSRSVPWSCSAQAQFSAVWPPSVGSSASMGVPSSRSFSMILRTQSGVMGSM